MVCDNEREYSLQKKTFLGPFCCSACFFSGPNAQNDFQSRDVHSVFVLDESEVLGGQVQPVGIGIGVTLANRRSPLFVHRGRFRWRWDSR